MFKKPANKEKKSNLSQFGLLDIPGLDNDEEPMDLSDDDMDLEAELAAISGGGGQRNRPRKPAPVPSSNLDAMIAASLKDIPSDDEGSGDDEDPDLLNELKELGIEDDEAPAPPPRISRPAPAPPSQAASNESSTISLLQNRISQYSLAEKNAKENGESSRARRFGRGLKTLNDLLKQAKSGKPINDEDIPPAVSVPQRADAVQPSPNAGESPSTPERPLIQSKDPVTVPQPPPRAPMRPLIDLEPVDDPPNLPEPVGPPPPPPKVELSPEKQEGLQIILKRRAEFKAAALSCKQSGDKAMALEYLKVAKQFDMVVDAYSAGQEMDLNELPTPDSVAAQLRSQKTEDQKQTSSEPAPIPHVEDSGLITASTVEEALKQRLAAFQQQESKAKEEGNASKARRLGRVVKQYQDAIKLHAAGKPIPVDELPTPLGHAPIPVENRPPPRSAPHPSPKPSPKPSPPQSSPHPSPHSASSRYEKQIAVLLLRQKQFKDAAIRAKKNGDIEKAKEYLRAAKGFDPMIEAAKGGLTVDFNSIPLPPKEKTELEHTFDIVSAEDCGPTPDVPTTISSDDEDVHSHLLQQLNNQLKLCLSNRDHNKAMGNVAEANRFEHLAVTVKQDLNLVTIAKSLGQNPPKFHYESRKFSVVQCNTDLNETDLELTIVRGIAYNVANPKDVDTYVKFEFPYPQDAPISDRTSLVKDTNNPEYNAVFPLAIQRGNRACMRLFKRHAIKMEVCSRGGWFSRDNVLGTLAVKLAPLETQVTLHDSFPLMDGRRPAGGSLEVKLRVRTPLVQQQIENTTHRWLVIDN